MAPHERQSRRSFDAKFKLRTVEFAEEHGNRAAGREFDVAEKMIWDWSKAHSVLRTMKTTKKANRSKKARWPDLERSLRTVNLDPAHRQIDHPRKRACESSCETEEQRASPTTCSDRTDAASVNEADVALTSETVETYHTDTACQTDRLVDCANCAAVQKWRCQLRAAKQQLRQCQTKLAEFRKKTAKYERQQQSLQRLSDREKLIIDQYKKDWLYDCLLLKTKSTSVYTYLQENNFLPLPNPRTLYCYMKSLKADFGFDAHVFTVLKEKLLTSLESVLMFDEMSVRKSLHVRESDMKVVGKVDFGEHTRPADSEKDADHVLVFLFRPFLGGWSQTVGTFCASSAAPGSILAKLVLQCIVHLCNAGAVIDAVTCDNSTTNRCALRSLGIRGDMKDQQVSFQHPCDPSKVISAIIDPPHIFKCIRNNLQKVGKFLLPQGREVYHDHYAALLEYEEQQSGLRAVPKLTRAHIYPNAFQKMSVKLAVQHTSNTVFAIQAHCLAILFDEVLLEPGETVEQASLLQHQQSPKEKILDYLAGYVAKKFSSPRCSSCVESLRSSERPATGLILVKSKGFLLVPSSQLVTLLQIVEDHMEAHTVEKTACSGVYMNIVEDVLMDPRTASAAVGCKSHFVSTTAEVVQFFLKGEVVKRVSQACNSISDKIIVAGFRKAGLIPCVTDVESESSESEDDSDMPEDDVPGVHPKIAVLVTGFICRAERRKRISQQRPAKRSKHELILMAMPLRRREMPL
ncbi:hypothetical protein HPB51_028700 [Rhipicephalus microplus]|uniref:Uncharacterized protein n=1 Tax=Rhipicephalus microplus TaxID=6941 RepID=A0A9J6CX39_RHIMP|nr:hypothetical protein HPB51_028700 [Rhipicephalus microplus]